jgi:hypothetical protein
MAARGMRTDALEQEAESRLPCWSFRAREGIAPEGMMGCDECLVRYLKVLDCFKLMAMRPSEGCPVRDCADCEYFRRYGGSSD